jgi:pimeloyl-ACP methyl ester carboxylesterase
MHEVREDTIELDEQPVFLLRAGESGDDDAPALYVHGVPTSADDWRPFLELGGGLAVDLPGFGRSGKRGDLDFTLRGYARWLPRLLDVLGIERVRLCVHDWGAAALAWAADHPERVERLVVVNALPLLPGYRWHRIARALRAPGLGEMAVGLAVAPVLRRVVRTGIVGECAPRGWLDDIAARFDQGTQRAVLRLYRMSAADW